MKNGKCWIAALCLGLVTLLGGDRLWAANPKGQPVDDVKVKMEAEGWQQVADGVFERKLGPNKVEHLGYGREGIAWTIGEISRKLEHLRAEQEAYPSEKLAEAIDGLTLLLNKTKSNLWNLDQDPAAGPSGLAAPLAGPSCSSICYSATADAYYSTSPQFVAAVADATFNSTCGFSGDTYAFAYARATLNGTTTTVSQSSPQSGTSVTSHAVASAYGKEAPGIPCYSEASSYAQSSALGISYSTSDVNNECPAPPVQPCTVTITGTSYESFNHPTCRSRTWTASVSGCTPFSYQWTLNGTVVGSGSTYTRSVCYYDGFFTLGVTVNGTATDTHDVWVDYYEENPCGGSGQFCP